MNPEAAAIIARLQLTPLAQEGGFFRQTWRSADVLPDGRAGGGAIYFLMTPVDFSALHRLRMAEVWHFYAGDPVEHLQLDSARRVGISTVMGSDLLAGHTPQLLAPAGVWQGARLVPTGFRGWSLMGTTTCPAWTTDDFELGSRVDLQREFGVHSASIAALTR